jgi:hypothetical protein
MITEKKFIERVKMRQRMREIQRVPIILADYHKLTAEYDRLEKALGDTITTERGIPK